VRGGFLLVDKPAGMTSHDVVAYLRKISGVRRIGHAGTLDKPAKGLLLVAIGRATRLLRFLAETDKSYRATVVFGVSTDTDDASGAVLSSAPCELSRQQVEEALAGFRGKASQRPPAFSAVQVGGERLYRRARRGESVAAPEREIVISRLELLDYHGLTHPQAIIEVDCSKGTYIRSLARDLGERLGCGAHLGDLVRQRIGRFTLESAKPLEELAALASGGELGRAMLPPEAAVKGWPAHHLAKEEAQSVRRGAALPALLQGRDIPRGIFALMGPEGELLAVAENPADQTRDAPPAPGTAGPRYLLVYSSHGND